MKHFLFLISLLLIFSAMLSGQVCNDKVENGYKGNPKYVTTLHYNQLEKEEGKWIVDDDNLYFKEQRVLDEKGFLIEKRYWDMAIDKVNPSVVVKMHYTNGIKDSFTKLDGHGIQIGYGKIKWFNSHNYSIVSIDTHENGATQFFLAQNCRDSFRIAYLFKADSMVYERTYTHVFDAKGELTASNVSDYLDEDYYTLKYTDKEKDKYGNWIKYAIINKESGSLIKYIVQEFEYYK